MKFTKYLKYVVIAGIAFALVFDSPLNPVTTMIAAASAEEPSAEERAEQARQAEIQRQYDEMMAELEALEQQQQ